MRIYVGNLAFDTTESEVHELFSQHGDVQNVTLVADRETGRPRGFGFVEMPSDSAAREAIGALDGTELRGRHITVNEARPRTDRAGGGERGGDRGGDRGGRRRW